MQFGQILKEKLFLPPTLRQRILKSESCLVKTWNNQRTTDASMFVIMPAQVGSKRQVEATEWP